jgi:hypothetical protein
MAFTGLISDGEGRARFVRTTILDRLSYSLRDDCLLNDHLSISLIAKMRYRHYILQ